MILILGILHTNKKITITYCINYNIKNIANALLQFYNNKENVRKLFEFNKIIHIISNITGELYSNNEIDFKPIILSDKIHFDNYRKDIKYRYLFDEELEYWTINDKRLEVYLS